LLSIASSFNFFSLSDLIFILFIYLFLFKIVFYIVFFFNYTPSFFPPFIYDAHSFSFLFFFLWLVF
jgi:hypothetical protein